MQLSIATVAVLGAVCIGLLFVARSGEVVLTVDSAGLAQAGSVSQDVIYRHVFKNNVNKDAKPSNGRAELKLKAKQPQLAQPAQKILAATKHASISVSSANSSDICGGHGVYHALVGECRCTAGWNGSRCERRLLRACNTHAGRGGMNYDSLCAGNCDVERGLCYCAGLRAPFQRPLQHHCAPGAHRTTKLPDGRAAYPQLAVYESRRRPAQYVRKVKGIVAQPRTPYSPAQPRLAIGSSGGAERRGPNNEPAPPELNHSGSMSMLCVEQHSETELSAWAPVIWERKSKDVPEGWTRLYAKPFELLYGRVGRNPPFPQKGYAREISGGRLGFCQARCARVVCVRVACALAILTR
eukprot:6136134-Pleurochrysis_carterae.AAC.2